MNDNNVNNNITDFLLMNVSVSLLPIV